MPYNVTATYTKEAAKLEGTYPVDMYVLNASLSGWEPLYYVNLNQDIIGFSLNASGNITNNATVYTGLPIERGDLGTNTSGEIGEVSITIPNTNRVIESIIQNRKYLRGRDVHIVSGFARHLPASGTLEDETGASWGPTVHGLSLADGSAFLKVSGVDLSPYANKNYKITLTDSVGKKAVGYIGAVDAAETLGSELQTNGDFASNINGWVGYAGYDYETLEWDGVGKLHAVNSAGAGYRSGPVFSVTAGKLYKVLFTLALASGTLPKWCLASSTAGTQLVSSYKDTVNGANAYDVVPTSTSAVARFFIYNTQTADYTLDDVSVQEVTQPGAYAAIADPLTLFEGLIDDWTLSEGELRITVSNLLTSWSQRTLAKHSASCRWKKFKGQECAYTGTGAWCDRSYTRCEALGNQAYFGGFRWLPSIVEKQVWWGKDLTPVVTPTFGMNGVF